MFQPNYGIPQAYNSIANYQQQLSQLQGQMSGQSTYNGNLIRVNGIEGAKAFQIAANSSVPLFDENTDTMFIKSTDGAGFPTIKICPFSVTENAPTQTQGDFVSRTEFEEFKESLLNGSKKPNKEVSNNVK